MLDLNSTGKFIKTRVIFGHWGHLTTSPLTLDSRSSRQCVWLKNEVKILIIILHYCHCFKTAFKIKMSHGQIFFSDMISGEGVQYKTWMHQFSYLNDNIVATWSNCYLDAIRDKLLSKVVTVHIPMPWNQQRIRILYQE